MADTNEEEEWSGEPDKDGSDSENSSASDAEEDNWDEELNSLE